MTFDLFSATLGCIFGQILLVTTLIAITHLTRKWEERRWTSYPYEQGHPECHLCGCSLGNDDQPYCPNCQTVIGDYLNETL